MYQNKFDRGYYTKIARDFGYDNDCFNAIRKAKTENEAIRALTSARKRQMAIEDENHRIITKLRMATT